MNFSLPCLRDRRLGELERAKASAMGATTATRRCGKKFGGRPFLSCASSRSGESLSGIMMRSFLCSPLVVVGKGLKLIGNRRVRHGSGSAEQSLCRF